MSDEPIFLRLLADAMDPDLNPNHPDYEGWAVGYDYFVDADCVEFDLKLSLELEIAGWCHDDFGGSIPWGIDVPPRKDWEKEIKSLVDHLKECWVDNQHSNY